MIVGKDDEYREHNRRVIAELRQLGLYPEGDIDELTFAAPGALDHHRDEGHRQFLARKRRP
jgi:hypothetical protein